MNDEKLQSIYSWVDQIPLSRAKKNIARDFSDGILIAEIVKYYHPKLIQMHNYTPANSSQQKMYNWNTLNNKVFRKLKLQMTKSMVHDMVQCKQGAAEECLAKLQVKIANYKPKEVQDEIPCHVVSDPEVVYKKVAASPEMEEDKDCIIRDQKETIEILELKIQKLEQLVRLKDGKIHALSKTNIK